MPDEQKRTMDEQADFVMSFVDESRRIRDEFEDIWDESERNWLVRPWQEQSLENQTSYPLGKIGASPNDNMFAVLKDPETHQAVMTIASKMILGVMGEPGFVHTRPVGTEDVMKSSVSSKLIEYALRKETHFQTFVEWVLSAAVYMTGVIEASWRYDEGPREFRSLALNPFTGEEESESEILTVPIYDDVEFRRLDPRDFFPDQGEQMIARMKGCAKRFRIPASEAIRRGEDGIYDLSKVKQALSDGMPHQADDNHGSGDHTMGTHEPESHPDFKMVIGYEYVGRVEYSVTDGIRSRVSTVLNGFSVRDDPWPRRLPFFDFRLTPRMGSFYGVSVCEVVRFDQDFADTMKMMLADAVTRSVHPPHVYNRGTGPDLSKLRHWRPNVPIGVDGDPRSAIAQAEYNPPVGPAFQMYSGVKQQMREGSGALGAIQGTGLGSKRFSATEAASTFEQALDRPELWAQMLERESLPPLGKYTLGLYQSFLETTGDLQDRVGASEYPVDLADILLDFDVEFIGSRLEGRRSEQISAFREIVAAGANPIIAQLVPWMPLLQEWFKKLGAHEIAAMVGNPQMIQLHAILNQVGGPNAQAGNGNGEQTTTAPTGLLPSQTLGDTQ